MLLLTRRLSTTEAEAVQEPQATLSLPFEVRQKGRFRAELSDGTPVAVQIARGMVIRGGDCLGSEDGQCVRILAAPEPISLVSAPAPLDLLRAAYHLGNRHVALQVQQDQLTYLQDHVLDAMCTGIGCRVEHEMAAFEPEPGAYQPQGHPH